MARALIIVDHGSRRPEAHAHLAWIAEQVRQRAPNLRVYIAHMELADPSIDMAIDTCVDDGASEIMLHPLFLVPGQHLTQDIPALIERGSERHPGVRIHLTDSLGSLPDLADLILRTL